MTVTFRVKHPRQRGSDVWWRANSRDGASADCGLSSNHMPAEATHMDFQTSNPVFAWTPYDYTGQYGSFSPHEIYPIPRSVKRPEFVFEAKPNNNDADNSDLSEAELQSSMEIACHPSHSAIYVSNDTNLTLQVKVGTTETDTQPIEILPQTREKEVAFALPNYGADPSVEIKSQQSELQATTSHGASIRVTYDDDEGYRLGIEQTPFHCPTPVYDVPIRCINRSGQDATLHILYRNHWTLTQTVHANRPPFIIWLDSHPTHLIWYFSDKKSGILHKKKHKVEYVSGMTLTIRSQEAIRAGELLLNAQHARGASVFVELLEDVGELLHCAPLFAKHRVEYSQLPLLSHQDWDQLNVPVGAKHRILQRLQQRSESLHAQDSDSEQCVYHVFISHKHEGWEDLAQAIKLQLLVMFPEKNLQIFLDVDNLQDLARLHQHVLESKHFLFLLTPGVLDSPYCQSEVRTALKAKKSILLVHDVKKCPIPDPSGLPDDLRPVLDRVAIPYFREHAFRETAMREIAKALKLS